MSLPDKELEEQFHAWMGDMASTLAELADTRPDPVDQAWIDSLYDIAHNIKGIGSSFGYPLLSDAGASLCSYIKTKGAGQIWHEATLLAHIKVFQVVYENKISGDGGPQGTALMDKLQTRVQEALA